MKVSGILGGLAVVAMLGGCTQIIVGPVPKGVGFTGVGSQPADTNRSYADGIFSNRQEAVPASSQVAAGQTAQGATRPEIRVLSNRFYVNRSTRARVEFATRRGGSKTTGVPVVFDGVNAHLSLLQIGDKTFSVMGARQGFFSGETFNSGSPKRFKEQMTALTGCTAQNGIYSWGPNRNVTLKMIAEVSCS